MSANSLNTAEICKAFGLCGDFCGYKAIDNGHINNTYVFEFDENGSRLSYLIQKINVSVFKKPVELMENIVGVTGYLAKMISEAGGDPARETMKVYYAKNGLPFFVDANGSFWRCLSYVSDTFTCNLPDSTELCYKAGKAFGRFQCLLADYPIDTLNETIPNFHNTPVRIRDLRNAVEADPVGRAASVADEIDFFLSREKEAGLLLNLLDKGELSLKVTHNDTKLNNVLFDNKTGDGICIVDLDTVMPGLSLYDFGDSLRFAGNTADEDEKDLSKVSFDIDVYSSYTKGYLEAAGTSLCPAEITYLPFSCKLMTFECGMRFLTDYLSGDTYFRTAYPTHNLDRCRTQFRLVSDMDAKWEKMQRAVGE